MTDSEVIKTEIHLAEMKWLYFERFKGKLVANIENGCECDECKFLLKIAKALTWSFRYGKHKDKDSYITLELSSSKHVTSRKFTTKDKIPVQVIFREYNNINELKTRVKNFFDAIKKLYSEIRTYCQINNISEDDFNILVYDERVWLRLDTLGEVFSVSYTDGKYESKTVATENKLFTAFMDCFRLGTGLNNVVFRMISRNNGNYCESYDIKYIYER